MSRFEATLLAEFVQESLELLEELGTACGELSSSTEPNAQLATIDRGLHTIKGNAAALGFMQLSAAASKVLQTVRGEATSGTPSAACLGRIWRFLVECRQYLLLVSNEKTPEEGFFTSADDDVSFAAEIPIAAPAEAIVLEANEISVEEILASVPEINPDIRRLIPGVEASARIDASLREPSAHEPEPEAAVEPAAEEEAPDPVAPAAASPPATEQESDAEATTDQRASMLASVVADFRHRAKSAGFEASGLVEVEEFLRELSGEGPERPLADYLRGVIDDAELLGQALKLKISTELEDNDIRVLPALGHLLRHLLTELVNLRLVHMSKNDSSIDWKIRANCAEDRLEVELAGLSNGRRASALDRVRMQSSLEFLEDLHGAVRTEKNSLILSLSVAGIHSENCRVIQSPDGRFCLAADAVRGAEDGSNELVVKGSEGETRMRVDSVASPQEMLVVDCDEELAEEGILGFALSFAHSEKIPLLDPDSI